MSKVWIYPEEPENLLRLDQWAEKLNVSPLIARILHQRGLKTLEEMDVFLSPGLKHLPPPADCPGMEQAARVAADATKAGANITVWGDYDVDGVVSSALLKEFFTLRGYNCSVRLPDRLHEGYGLNTTGVEELAEAGCTLLITVDCGITDMEPIAAAVERGMTVVVTDHHLPGPKLPPAHAIADPKLSDDETSPLYEIAGVGVAFYLACALNKLLPGDPMDVRRLLDLVALGTLADVVKLKGVNRILAKNGLLLIAEGSRPGIAALKEISGYSPKAALGAGQVVFGLAPRINAVGRMAEAQTALNLLLSPDVESARPAAAILDRANKDRRAEEDRIMQQALEQAEQFSESPGLILFGEDWHHGVVGIVASRIMELYYKPVILMGRDRDKIKGSGRAVPEFNIFDALSQCRDLLEEFGGHKAAAGLSIREENLETLRERFNTCVIEQVGAEPLQPKLRVDAVLPFADIDFTLLKELELLQPYGAGNPEPVFSAESVEICSRRRFGKNHVKLELRDTAAGVTLRGKAWRKADDFPESMVGKKLKPAFTPKIDRYNGLAAIDLILKDWDTKGDGGE